MMEMDINLYNIGSIGEINISGSSPGHAGQFCGFKLTGK